MRFVAAILFLALAAPVLLVAVALGPVTIGILCAIGFGMLVTAIADALIGAGQIGHSLERRGLRLIRRT